MGVETFLVASSLAGVLAQRLVRTVCDECSETKPLGEGACRELGVDPLVHAGKMVREGKGCIACQHTGYRGRTGIYELMMVDDVVRELVLANADSSRVKKAAREGGMETLREDGLRKILSGQTTVAEVCRVTTEEAVLD
jgi:general secretion pathway protein E